ncbi:hypothetical protein BCR41DRAFT_156411 [Lobosporangium transversale]|uniref:Uncharacterized protein n=1 Tax=Lobosporangium transversale TaxID=64571 RepID=A0A1Y2H354_9FUNG|nr:hypothetical protein BCR41DRAFT_156411 [Lobosporangium transversale]ORZ27502.1 hypothetical protein BCR41DRAFT_156411 [Lobosporangium transversale]|eukprot:XP_021885229.1 hypothetical protein BCR41DRAFT_156411 [Lobosporangium transversale]
MAETTEQIEATTTLTTVDPATASSSNPTEDTSIVDHPMTDKQSSAPTDDEKHHTSPPVDATSEIEQEHASDSAISLSIPGEIGKEKSSRPESAAEITQSEVHIAQDENKQPNDPSMETDEAAPVPEAESTATEGQDDAPVNDSNDPADPYTEQDGTYRDTELVSDVPVPEGADVESGANQSHPEEDSSTTQTNDNAAKPVTSAAPPSGKTHHTNHQSRHHQRGGRGGFHNRNNNHNFQNNRPFNQRFNSNNNNSNHHHNHGNHNHHGNNFNNRNNHNNHSNYNNHNHNNSNNSNNFNNFNSSNNSGPNSNNSYHGGPGPMRRGGYRGNNLIIIPYSVKKFDVRQNFIIDIISKSECLSSVLIESYVHLKSE